MGDIGKLVDALVEDVGVDGTAVEKVMEHIDESASGKAMVFRYPVTESGDALLTVNAFNGIDGELLYMGVVLPTETRIYLVDEDNAQEVLSEVRPLLRGLTVYLSHESLVYYGESIGEEPPAQALIILDEQLRSSGSPLRKCMLSRSRGNTKQRRLGRHVQRMFMDYYIYLNLKFEAKNINGGRYMVRVSI